MPVGGRALVKRLMQRFCRIMASRPVTRRLLNAKYNSLALQSKIAFHRLFTEIFNEQDGRLVEGEWHVKFNGNIIRLPLRPSVARLDWTAAISILGHDSEVKSTYAHLLANRDRPIDVFLDIGANFGTHSILFASSGVKVIAFEPNPDCQSYCMAVAALNHLSISWVNLALSDHDGEANLIYPKNQTWLGSIETNASGALKRQFNGTVTARVKLDILDHYTADLPLSARILMKIDVEGGELSVLQGARSLLARDKAPWIIFESNNIAGRPELEGLLSRYGYRIFTLPFGTEPGNPSLTLADFLSSPVTNFIAVHREGDSGS